MELIKLYKKSFEGLRPQVWYLALMMLVNRMGTLILPFLTLYTTQELGWSIVDSGIASACFGVGSLFGALLGGFIVDRFGYWKIILIAQLGAAAAFFSLQFLHDFYPLCIALFLSSLISDTLRPATMTGVTMISKPEARTRAISLMRMSFNLGFAIGPAIAGVLIAMTSYRAIFNMDAITCLLAGIFALFYIQNDRDKDNVAENNYVDEGPKRSPYRDTSFLMLMLFSWIMLLAFFQMLFTVPLYMKEELLLCEDDIGLFFAINGILIFVSEMPIVYFTEHKWRLMPAMILGVLMVGVSYLFLTTNLSPWLMVGIYVVLISYGEIISFPFITSLSLRRTTKRNVGQYMGAVSMLFSFAIILAPIIGTNLITHYGYNAAWFVSAILCGIACLGYYLLDDSFKLGTNQSISS